MGLTAIMFTKRAVEILRYAVIDPTIITRLASIIIVLIAALAIGHSAFFHGKLWGFL